jgi:hypothetical protein
MQANDVLEQHKALLTTRQKTARVTSLVSLVFLVGVLLVPVLFITQADYQPDVVGVLMFAFLALTNAIQLGKALAGIRTYEELIGVLDAVQRAMGREGSALD